MFGIGIEFLWGDLSFWHLPIVHELMLCLDYYSEHEQYEHKWSGHYLLLWNLIIRNLYSERTMGGLTWALELQG